ELKIGGKGGQTEDDKQPTDPDPFSAFPYGEFAENHHASGWKVAFLESPPTPSSPIEQIDVVVPDHGDFLRFRAVEDPQSHPSSNLTVCSPAHHIAAHGSVTDIYVIHRKDRCVRGICNHRNGLGCVNKVCARSILHKGRMIDNRLARQPP